MAKRTPAKKGLKDKKEVAAKKKAEENLAEGPELVGNPPSEDEQAAAPQVNENVTERPNFPKLPKAPIDLSVISTDIMVRATEEAGRCETTDLSFVDAIYRWLGIGAVAVRPSALNKQGDPAPFCDMIYTFNYSKEQIEEMIKIRKKEVKGY